MINNIKGFMSTMPETSTIRVNLPVHSSPYYCSLSSVAVHTIADSRYTLNQ